MTGGGEDIVRGAWRIVFQVDRFFGVSAPFLPIPLEDQIVGPLGGRAAELDVEPIEASLLIVGAVEAGDAQRTQAVRLTEQVIDLERGVVSLLHAPGIRYLIVVSPL